MNIFALDLDPKLAAQYHCDRHVVKMLLESCQILSTVMHLNGAGGPYKPTHRHHPCVKWAGASQQNFDWLKRLMNHLCAEYTARYGKVHKCQQYLSILDCTLPDIGQTPFSLAMPNQYRSPDAIEAYRAYYLGEKARFAKWKASITPFWWIRVDNPA